MTDSKDSGEGPPDPGDAPGDPAPEVRGKGRPEDPAGPGEGEPSKAETIFTHRTSFVQNPRETPPDPAPDTASPTLPPHTHPETVYEGPDLSTEKTLGPYRILAEIGRGGMGVVHKAYHSKLKRIVALKVLIAGEDASDEAITRFHREAEAVAKLGHHPNIVPIYEIGQEGRLHYFAMHFVDGKPLDRMIFDGEVAPKRAAVFTKRIAEALSHAHGHGVLHRDVKPANILVSKDGEPHLTDFGLAKNVESDTKMTRSGMTLGTPQYMPPEQAEGRLSDVDARSDIYSLGATLYEMLTGIPPFQGEIVINVIKKMLTEDAISPRKSNPGISKDIETICLKCLEKDPARRYASALALAEDLARTLEGRPILARPISRPARLWRRAKRNKAATAGIVGMALLGLALGLFTLGPGELNVVTDPPGAAVLIDGEAGGLTTPVKGRLLWPPGRYRVGLQFEGYDSVDQDVKITALTSRTVSIPMTKDHGFVKIAVRPAEATVTFLVEAEHVKGVAFRCEPKDLPGEERADPGPEVKKDDPPYSFRCY
ncbi:MAG: serine/threonine-protein kinase, partial [Planctomycetota bacterium]